MNDSKSLLIIGGGIIGMAIAREAALRKTFQKITLIEKEKNLGFHASSRNSGVIHAGFYYSPDSQKALFCAEANRMLRDYCLENNIETRKSGKVVVSQDEEQLAILENLYKRGVLNNSDVSLLSADQLINYEPLALTYSKFIWSPNTWSANPKELIKVMQKQLNELGVNVVLNKKIDSFDGTTFLDNYKNKYFFDYVINAAGAHSLKVAKMMGINTEYILLPFKGMYLRSKRKVNKFKTHIYPVPNINQPFLGIHTTLTSNGFLKLGPTALPVLSPENYKTFEGLDFSYLPSIVFNQIKLFLNNSFGYRNLAFQELSNLFKFNILKSAQKLTKAKLFEDDFEWYTPGIRAQLLNKNTGKLEMDFVNISNSSQYHILNSISPAWTCSLKTAKYVIDQVTGLRG